MREITVDLFAGGGGASVGIERAIGRPADVAINHDPLAIHVHQLNHPETEHWTADLWRIPPSWAVQGQPRELFAAQGFPENYRLDGMNKTQQVRLCGNSVPPQFSETLVKANYQIEDQREDKSSLPLFRGTAAKKVERVSA